MREGPMRATVIAWLAVPLMLAGCDKKIWVTQYPRFWSKDRGVDAVAVYPFRGTAASPYAGERLADRLAAALVSNGAYRVITGGARADGPSAPVALTGTVTAYHIRQEWGTEYYGPYRYEVRAGGRRYRRPGYPYRRRYYGTPTIRATVGCTAELIDLASGHRIHSFSTEQSWARTGGSVATDGNRAIERAMDMVVQSLVEEFAPVRQQIAIGDNAIRTASGGAGDRWHFTERFSSSDRQLHVVLELPAAAAFNRFRVVLARRGGGAELAGRDMLWPGRQGRRALAFDMAEILAAGGGPGKYVAELHYDGRRVRSRKFEIAAGGAD